MPIVPNFILKLEESNAAKEEKPNITNIVCKERDVIDDSYERKIIREGNLNDKDVSGANVSFVSDEYDASKGIPMECRNEVNKTAEREYKKKKKQTEYEEYGDANVKAGIMFGSKALVQMLFNPFVGPITNRLVRFNYYLTSRYSIKRLS